MNNTKVSIETATATLLGYVGLDAESKRYIEGVIQGLMMCEEKRAGKPPFLPKKKPA